MREGKANTGVNMRKWELEELVNKLEKAMEEDSIKYIAREHVHSSEMTCVLSEKASLEAEIKKLKEEYQKISLEKLQVVLKFVTEKNDKEKLISDLKAEAEKHREEIMVAERNHDALYEEFHAFVTKLLEDADTQEELQFLKENASSIVNMYGISCEFGIHVAFVKKLNTLKNRDLKKTLKYIDHNDVENAEYLSTMNFLLKTYANIEHDALDILKRKKSLPNAEFVFRSILAIENVHLDWLED